MAQCFGFMNKAKNQIISAFVVKLIVVLLVLVLPAAIIIPSFSRGETAFQNVCVNNLRQIEGAKQRWSLQNLKGSNDTPTIVEISPYLKQGVFPTCPVGGVYTVGKIGSNPTCNLRGHKLP
jgi:hypothetical protein